MIKKKPAVAAYKFRVGNNIRKWRNIKDIKQKDLANSLNLSEAAVSNIENDLTNITVTQLEDIAIALNVSIEKLLSDPHEKLGNSFSHPANASAKAYAQPMDPELLHALISSLEKKDNQLQLLMQQFIQTLGTFMQQEKIIYNGSKQVASRA